jgi:hypothetical protein
MNPRLTPCYLLLPYFTDRTVKMEAVCYSESLVICHITRRNITDETRTVSLTQASLHLSYIQKHAVA